MKNFNFIYIFFILFGIFLSCSKDFNEMGTDPNQFKEASPEAALQGAFKNLTDFMARANTERWWDVANMINISGRYDVSDGGLWQISYVNVLEPLHQIKLKYQDNPLFQNRLQIARIWECYTYSVLTADFGPVPRSQANNPDYLSEIKYDHEDSVYTYILTTLKEAGETINTENTDDRLQYDAIFGGGDDQLVKWKKFANTLRLKIALRCHKNLTQLSEEHIRDVMQNEQFTISSEEDAALMHYENVINNESPYFIKYNRNSYTLDPLAISDMLFIYLRSYNDARLDAYIDSVPLVQNQYLLRDTLASTHDDSLRIVTYHVPHFAKPKSTALLPGWTNIDGNNPMTGINVNVYSRPKGYGWGRQAEANGMFAPDKSFMILSYAETLYLKAEAVLMGIAENKTAEQYYEEGIDAAFAHWDILPALAEEYKARDGVKWGTEGHGFPDFLNLVHADIPADNLSKVYVQQWLNFYPDQAFDAWSLQRQTRALNFTPHTNPPVGVVNTPYLDLPLRSIYPLNAAILNAVGYKDALQQLGTQQNDFNPYLKLNFVKDYTVPDWNSRIPRYNAEYLVKWYGNTIEDLQLKGIEYSVLGTIYPSLK